MNKVFRVLKNAVYVLLILTFLLIAFVTVCGAKGYSVESNSMSPKLNRGDVVFVKKTDFNGLKKGDIVTVEFKTGGGTYTHRIAQIDYNKKEIRTVGDSTNVIDMESATESQIKGKVWFSLPLLGYPSLLITNRVFIAIIAFVALGIVAVGAGFRKKAQKNERGEENEHKKEVNN